MLSKQLFNNIKIAMRSSGTVYFYNANVIHVPLTNYIYLLVLMNEGLNHIVSIDWYNQTNADNMNSGALYCESCQNNLFDSQQIGQMTELARKILLFQHKSYSDSTLIEEFTRAANP